jgi:hypothetical protein
MPEPRERWARGASTRDLFSLLRAVRHPLAHLFLSYAKRYCAAFNKGYGLDTTGTSDRSCIPCPSQGLIRRQRHHPLPPHRHRRQRLLPQSNCVFGGGDAPPFSSSVSSSLNKYQSRAACAADSTIRIRVSRSTDDLASLVPRNVRPIERAPAVLRTSGSRPDAMPTSRII